MRVPLLLLLQLFVQLGGATSLVLLSSSGSLLSHRAGEASRAAASPAFMAGQVLMPSMLDYMVCQVRVWATACLHSTAGHCTVQHMKCPASSI
jgi:hypothetical protein